MYHSDAKKHDFFVFCPRLRSLDEAKISHKLLARSLFAISKYYGAHLKIVVMNEKEDLEFANELVSLISSSEVVILRAFGEKEDEHKNSPDPATVLCGAKFVISSRYHGALLATALGIPTLAVSSDEKLRSLCKDFSIFPLSSPKILGNYAILCEKIDKMLLFFNKNEQKIAFLVQKNTLLADKYLEEIAELDLSKKKVQKNTQYHLADKNKS